MRNLQFEVNTDIVLCLDVTAGMQPLLENLREHAHELHAKLREEFDLSTSASPDMHIRIKLIAFRDYSVDEEPMFETVFFTEDENVDFANAVNRLRAWGGGSPCENSLEALDLAIRSDWVQEGYRRRHIIMLITDSVPVPLGKYADFPGYPSRMSSSLDELMDLYNGKADADTEILMDQRGKRLVLCTPEVEPWTDLWAMENTLLFPTNHGDGCADFDMDTLVNILAFAYSRVIV
jgi:hypothetical protein